tara:strand:+ start:184 stop:555 length:372 start_codon:yes stop_codon:yes gene_type:complete
MAITVTNKIDNTTQIVNSALGEKNLSEQTLVDVVNSTKATSQPKVSVKNISYDITGTGKVKVYYKNDDTKFVELSGNGIYGLRDTETILRQDINVIGDILIDTDSDVKKFFLIIECEKIGGYL